jgi:prepilin-type N-terminal cleavage/methylation domain-containing protein
MSNEKGFTLIELLAGLLLFSIVSVAAVSLTVQAMHNNTNAETTNSLRNDATYVTQVLRTAYENGTLNNMCLDKIKENTLKSDNHEINLQINTNTLSSIAFSYEGSDTSKPYCFNSQSEDTTLQVKFTISNNNNESFDVDTAFSKPSQDDLAISLTKPKSNPEFTEMCKKEIDSLRKEIQHKVDEHLDVYEHIGDVTMPDRDFPDDEAVFKVTNGSLNILGDLNIEDIFVNVDHDFHVNDELELDKYADVIVGKNTTIDDELKIDKSILETHKLTVKDELKTYKNSLLLVYENVNAESGDLSNKSLNCIGGDASFEHKLKLDNHNELFTGGTLTAAELKLDNHSTYKIGKDVIINGEVKVDNHAIFEIGGDIYSANKIELDNHSRVEVQGTGKFDNEVEVDNDAYLFINGDTFVNDSIDMDNHSKIYINGNLHVRDTLELDNHAHLIVNGDLTVEEPIKSDSSHAVICVTGNVSFDTSKFSDMTVLSNQKCQN